MRYYIECGYGEKEEAKKLGAKWDWEKRKWYYTNKGDKPKFAKWIVDEIKKLLPDLSSRFDEDIENDKNKYFLQIGRNGKIIVEEFISLFGYYECCDYPLKKEWLCNECSEWEDEFDKLYSVEECEKMTQKEIRSAEDEIIAKCKIKNCDNWECEAWGGYCSGNIQDYIDLSNGYIELIYLGQLESIEECREYLSKFGL